MLVTERNKRRLCAMNQLLRNQQLATLEPLVIEEAQHGLLDDEAFDAARALDLVPLTIYLATLGIENLRRRVIVRCGWRFTRVSAGRRRQRLSSACRRPCR